MLSKVMSTAMLPSPVSVFGTMKATRGLIAFRRSSKLSTSISRNLRSATGGSGSVGLPDRSAMTPITNGSWTFFSRTVRLHVVLDLHARCAVSGDELLTACFGHGLAPFVA